MNWQEILSYAVTLVSGGILGSLITIKVKSTSKSEIKSNTVQQNNNKVTNGNITGRDQK